MATCPVCKRAMTKKEHLSFNYALQIAIDNAIRSVACMPPKPTEWACKSMLPNPAFKEWLKKKEKNDKALPLFKKKLPPPPPEFIPCKNHWSLKSNGRTVSGKMKKTFFLVDSVTGFVSEKRGGV